MTISHGHFWPPPVSRPISKYPNPCNEISLGDSEECKLETWYQRLLRLAAVGALVTSWIEIEDRPIQKIAMPEPSVKVT